MSVQYIKDRISVREGVYEAVKQRRAKNDPGVSQSPIPKYVYEHEAGRFDLMDCYEAAFAFANGLL